MPRRWLWWLASLAAFVLLAAQGASATTLPPERWSAWGDTPFRQHAQPLVVGAAVLAQDASGMIWIGTQAGLVRSDGYRFHPYAPDPDTPGTLPDSNVTALHVDARGRLWVGTSSGGLARFDAARDRFITFAATAIGSSAANVHAIAGDGLGGLWVGTAAGLQHVDDQDRMSDALSMPGLPAGGVDGLLRDRAGTLWAMTPRTLLRRPRGAAAFTPVPMPAVRGEAPVITRLYEDSGGRVWAGSQAHGAFVIEPGGARVTAVVESGPRPALASDRVLSIVEAVPGELWIGTEGGGIVVVDTARGTTRRIRHQAGTPGSLADDEVMSMLRDRSGILWVGTNKAMHQHDPQQRSVVTLRGADDKPDGISHANVPFVLPMDNGHVWLAVGAGGIDIVDPLRGRVAQLRPDAAQPTRALPKARVLSMATGPGGRVYIGTRLGLYLSDPDGGRVQRLDVTDRDATATVAVLCVDGDTLWFGGPDGVWALDVRDPAHPRLLRHEGSQRFANARVVSLLRQGNDTLWVGTSAGLHRMNTVSGHIEALSAGSADLSADTSRMPAGYVTSMLIDRRGRLWLSSFGNGVVLQEGRNADGSLRFRRFGLREGMPHVGVNKLLEDARGDIWVSTDEGLAVIDHARYTVRALQGPQGLDIPSYWSNSGAVTAEGELLFGGLGGLVAVRPERFAPWTYRPFVVVTEARVGETVLPPGGFNEATGTVPRIEVAAATRGLSVEFAALDYSAPERNRYAYRLLGFDAHWIATDASRRLASYTNLPPGDYTLQLRGSNRDGLWSEPPLTIPVHVLPAWYQTLWARAAAGAAVLIAFAALLQARTVYLRRRQRELEALVAERTAELHESQRQLEQIAYADSLTGLPNRRVFTEDLRRQVAQSQRSAERFALLLVDLDGFKNINDTHGHDAGDALLVEAAARFGAVLREGDRVARLGGDEFAVLLAPGSEREAVDTICRRLVERFAEPVNVDGAALLATASVGAALYPSDGATPDALYKAADMAMYEAKRGGRNTWRRVNRSQPAPEPAPPPRSTSQRKA